MKFFWFPLVTIIVFLLDRTTKYWWGQNVNIPLLGDTVSITSTSNKGIAFSIPLEGIFLILVTIVVILGGIIFVFRTVNLASPLAQVICGMVLGGALGNLYDRIFQGYVTDFIKVSVFPVFNLADSFICIGGLLFLAFYKRIELKKQVK